MLPVWLAALLAAQDPAALFDGKSLDSWSFKAGGWTIEDGAMALQKGGGYIWTKADYADFELELEVKLSKGCNSGIFVRTDPADPVQKGLEIQVLDSAGKEKPGKHDFGALYDALAPSANPVKPAGEWNAVKIACVKGAIRVSVNGTGVLEADLDQWDKPGLNPDGSKNKFAKALKEFPRSGRIGFQDHGQPVWYRNVKVKQIQ